MKDALYRDAGLAQFYDWDCPWTADHDWFVGLVEGAGTVLDLGCGTGMLTAALAAKGVQAVGVDPAGSMLAIARARDGGRAVEWVHADARRLSLGRRFGAVMMTGHAFQCLLTGKDRGAVLTTIARHLVPGGRFFFDSRNPEAREWRAWGRETSTERRRHPDFGQVERWNEATMDANTRIVTYQTGYRLQDGREFAARSRIAFPSCLELTGLIAAAGLTVDTWYGDARGGPLHAGCPDFIPVGGLAGGG